MRLFVAALLSVSLAGIAPGQTKKTQTTKPPATKGLPLEKITPQGQGGWVKSKMTIGALATKVSASILALRNTKADMRIDVTTPEGSAIFTSPSVVLKIRDPKHYRVDYAVIQRVPFSASLTFDGTNRRMRFDDKVQTVKGNPPLPAASKVTGDRLVALFDVDFPRLVFQGFTEGVDVWKSVLAGWSKGVDGYKATVEERKLTYQGVKYLNYRIRAVRSGAPKTKLGASEFELIIDGSRFLPVTIRNVRKMPNGENWSTLWAIMYRFNQTITNKELTLGN